MLLFGVQLKYKKSSSRVSAGAFFVTYGSQSVDRKVRFAKQLGSL